MADQFAEFVVDVANTVANGLNRMLMVVLFVVGTIAFVWSCYTGGTPSFAIGFSAVAFGVVRGITTYSFKLNDNGHDG